MRKTTYVTEPNPLTRIQLGVVHHCEDKKTSDTTHPIWIFIVTAITCLITDDFMDIFTMFSFMITSFLIELINSAIERTNDRIGTEYDEDSKKAKELATAATTLSRLPPIIFILWLLYKKNNVTEVFNN